MGPSSSMAIHFCSKSLSSNLCFSLLSLSCDPEEDNLYGSAYQSHGRPDPKHLKAFQGRKGAGVWSTSSPCVNMGFRRNPKCFICRLPFDLLVDQIFIYLSVADIIRLRRVGFFRNSDRSRRINSLSLSRSLTEPSSSSLTNPPSGNAF